MSNSSDFFTCLDADRDDGTLSSFFKNRELKNSQNKTGTNKKFKCSCCGVEYEKQKGNFYPNTHSFLWKGNNGFLCVCKSCVDMLFTEYASSLESKVKAIHRIAVHFDYYYSEQLATDAINSTKNTKTIIGTYIKECDAKNNQNTYDNFLTETNQEDKLAENIAAKKTQDELLSERWGSGIYTKKEIQSLEEHYHMLKKNNPNVDGNQEVFIKDLCLFNLQKLKATKSGDAKGILDFTKAYRDTFKQSQLQLTSDSIGEDTLGITLETISKYTPEEYYKDKSLYKDFDGLEEYFTRFILRPLKNLVLGTRDKDPDYKVKVEEGQNNGTV